VLVGVPIALYQALKWTSAKDAATIMSEMDNIDPNWRLDDLEGARETLDPAENSALLVMKIVAMGGPTRTSQREFYEQFDNVEPQHELNAVQMELLREAYANIENTLIEARKLKDMPKGRFPITYNWDFFSTNLNNQQNARRVFEMLQHDAWMQAQRGELDEAVESCRAGLNAARSLGDEPLLISLLIRISGNHMALAAVERTLAQGRPTEQALKPLQELIEREIIDAEKHWRNAIRGERAGNERVMEGIRSGKIRVSQLLGGVGTRPGLGEGLADHFPVIITRESPEMLRYMNQAVEITKLPHEEQTESLAELQKSIPKSSVLLRMLAPALEKVGFAHLRTQAMLRSAQVGIAAERYRLKHERWPESIAELEKAGLISGVPTDPFDGAPLRWRRLTDGMAAYSVGNDRQDDQGNINNTRPLDKGTDIGIRIWDTDRRRQAARPPLVLDEHGQIVR
jgi:hypothetical protein